MNKFTSCFVALVVWTTTSGCALTSKSSPLPLRFFSPTSAEHGAPASVAPRSELGLRLGRIEAGAHIEEQIAFRKSPTELSYYQGLRWTESPESYVRARLASALFDERGLGRVISGVGPTLDVELNEFEELQFGERRARVSLRFVLRDERRAIIEQLVVEEQALRAVNGTISEEGLPEAMARALDAAITTVANRVVEQLRALDAPTDVPRQPPDAVAPAPR